MDYEKKYNEALEQASKEYCPDDAYPFASDIINKEVRKAFIAGAKWHADHTPLPEDTVIWNDGFKTGREVGAREQKEHMMKDAVKWLVDDDYYPPDKGKFILGSVGIGYNGYYIPYSDLLKLPKEGER